MQTRKLQAGQTLLNPGDRVQSTFVVQEGILGLFQEKNDKLLKVSELTAPCSIGDEAVFGSQRWTLKVMALQPTTVLEVPNEMLQDQLSRLDPKLQSIYKSLSERGKTALNDIKAVSANRETQACPPESTSMLFGVIFHTARILGTADEKSTVVSWNDFQAYAFDVFGQPVSPLMEGVKVLIKLGYASLEGGSDARMIRFFEMKQIESFFEFFGHYYFKSGVTDMLKTHPRSTRVTEELLKIASKYPMDRAGFVHLPYKETIDAMKAVLGITFEADQIFRLEQKGLLIKRSTTSTGGTLSFYKADFEQMILNWKLLSEIETWSSRGYVELAEEISFNSRSSGTGNSAERQEISRKLAAWKPQTHSQAPIQIRREEKAPGEIWCETCLSVVQKDWTHCQVCGSEIKPAA